MRSSVPDGPSGQAHRHHRTRRRALSLLLTVTLLGAGMLSLGPAATSADDLSDAYQRQKQLQQLIKKQKAEIANLAASQRSLTAKISSTKASLSELNANLQVVKTQIVSMVVEVAKAQSAIDELVATSASLDADLADLEAEQAAKQAELDARKALLAERIREAYETDRTSLLESFLAGADFADVLTEVGYHLDFAGQDKELADQIVADQAVLAVMTENVQLARQQTSELHALADEQKQVLDGQLADLADARAELAKLEAQTARLLAEQQAAYAGLAADRTALEKKLAENQEAQRKLEALIDRLVREALAKGGIPSAYSGTFEWPMSGTVTQEFGCTGFFMEPPLGNCRHFHRGIDIAATAGTRIRAAGPGKVIFAGRSPYDPAYIVIIAHASNLVTWYGHVQTNIPVRAGQYVAQGDVIAYEGCTGWCTGPHLHWAVQLNGNWVNPRLFLPR